MPSWYTCRPIVTWPQPHTESRRLAPFRNKQGERMPLTDTLEILQRETRALGASEIIIQAALPEKALRLDGTIRADAGAATHPGVIVSFDSRHGALSYPCDTFTRWQDNLRAVALALEALRTVDRYGVTSRGEQYRGWAAIEPATPPIWQPAAVSEAAGFIASTLRPGDFSPTYHVLVARIQGDVEEYRRAYREAAKRWHPDAQGGNEERFKWLQGCRDLLDAHHGAGK